MGGRVGGSVARRARIKAALRCTRLRLPVGHRLSEGRWNSFSDMAGPLKV